MIQTARRLAVVLPLTLTHFRVLAEVDLDILGGLLLVHSFLGAHQDRWNWVRQPWFLAVLAWWGWQIVCTVCALVQMPQGGGGALVQALVAVRFPLAAAALGHWVLVDPVWRRRILYITFGCAGYIAAQMVFQAIFGINFFGQPRYMDGTLTGPYCHPRSAAPLSRLVLPILMVIVTCCGSNPVWHFAPRHRSLWRWVPRWPVLCQVLCQGGAVLSVAALMVLAGQRMPFLLVMLGLALCAFFYCPMRLTALLGFILTPCMIMLARIVSPASFHHLVTLTRHQLSHFSASPYGEIYERAMLMASVRPIHGYGYDGYRHYCVRSATLPVPGWLHVPPPDNPGFFICVQHPHNLYLQALVNGGLPGLCFFTVLVVLSLRAIWPSRPGHALPIGLFAAVFVQYWPLTSSSDFLNLPLGGWGFLLFALALACRARENREHCDAPRPGRGFSRPSGAPILVTDYGGSHVRNT